MEIKNSLDWCSTLQCAGRCIAGLTFQNQWSSDHSTMRNILQDFIGLHFRTIPRSIMGHNIIAPDHSSHTCLHKLSLLTNDSLPTPRTFNPLQHWTNAISPCNLTDVSLNISKLIIHNLLTEKSNSPHLRDKLQTIFLRLYFAIVESVMLSIYYIGQYTVES